MVLCKWHWFLFSLVVSASGQPSHLFYFWVAALGFREGSFSLAEKAKMCLFIPFVSSIDPRGAFEESQSC